MAEDRQMQPRTSTGIKTLADKESTSDMMAFDDSNHVQRMDIFQNKDQLTISLSNVPMVQVGKSVRILKEVKSCCNQRCKQNRESRTADKGRLKDNSIPDDASTLHSSSSRVSSILSQTFELQCDHKNQRKTDDTSSEAQQHSECDVQYKMPDLIKKHGSLKGDKCEIIMKKLEELQDNGEFESHENLACGLLKFYSQQEDPDMKATLMIERGVAFYYANDCRKSRKLYKDAILMGNSLHNRDLLQGRAYFQLAACYRLEKKFGKAIQCLKRAEELLCNHESGEDTAELNYVYGTIWLDIYCTNLADVQGRKAVKEEAKKYLERSAENCARDDRPRVQLKKNRYFNLRIAALHLDCGLKAARETCHVTSEDIEEAKKRLDFVEYFLSDGIPPGTKVQLLKTRSDQYYRQGKVRLAMETAEEALVIAEQANMKAENIQLNERIQERLTLLARDTDLAALRMSDSGWSADESSTA